MLKQFFIKTTYQKTLAFLADHPDEAFHVRELSRRTKLSKSQIDRVLNELREANIVSREQKGKMLFYSLNEHPAVKQFRILKTILDLEPLIEALKSISKKVILYGSRSTGTNLAESDLDLFIVSNKQDEVFDAVRNFEKQQTDFIDIKPVIRSTAKWMALEDEEPVYFNELLKGIILWEKPIDESKL